METMESVKPKKDVTSKTILFNVAALAVFLPLLKGFGVDPEMIATLVVTVLPLVNIILRYVTDTPIQFFWKKDEDAA